MRIIYTMILVLIMGVQCIPAKAQQTYNISDVKQKFTRWFKTMDHNRSIYNRYNDSIFLIHDHDRWVKFFYKRARINTAIYNSNKLCTDSIKAIIQQPWAKTDTAVCRTFFNAFFDNYVKNKSTDPFELIDMCDRIESIQSSLPDSLKFTNYLNAWRGASYFQIWNITKDREHLQKSYDYYKMCTIPEAKRYANSQSFYIMCMAALCIHHYTINGIETTTDLRHRIRDLRIYIKHHHDFFDQNPKNYNSVVKRLNAADENLIRNIYMVDTTTLPKKTANRMMRKLVAANLRNLNLTDQTFLRTALMRIHLNETTPKEVLEQFLPRYKKAMAEMQGKRFSSSEFSQHLTPYSTLFYLNDIADIPYRKKRKNVLMMCHDIETAFQHRSDQQAVTNFVKDLNIYVTYSRITKYLKPKERIDFLTNLSVSTNVTTYAHLVHVSKIATTLTASIIDHQPELLTGYLGCKTANSVKRHKQQILNYVRKAAIYHDLGKNAIIPVVDNDYRPITDMEYQIIKRHPEMGVKYLKLDQQLGKYHDTTRGHHKWYNGKGGYPDNFDNTTSPYRIMIDIITLSDCMQAATERIGRNYKNQKTLENVMGEFRRDAGTRYNPNLIKFIDTNPELAQELNNLLNDGWVEIYYNIYSKYFVQGKQKGVSI